jgi:hypothetical protein
MFREPIVLSSQARAVLMCFSTPLYGRDFRTQDFLWSPLFFFDYQHRAQIVDMQHLFITYLNGYRRTQNVIKKGLSIQTLSLLQTWLPKEANCCSYQLQAYKPSRHPLYHSSTTVYLSNTNTTCFLPPGTRSRTLANPLSCKSG